MRITRWLLFATLLVPVMVFPGFFFPFITIRAVYFRVLIELAFALLIYLVLRRNPTTHFRRDFVFWSLLAWTATNALAAAFGPAPMRSFFGDHERMGGVWFWIHLLAYYVLLRVVLRANDWWAFFRLSVGVASAISVYGLVQDWFRPFNFVIGGIGTGVTVGNSGLLAVYFLANIAFCALLAARSASRARFGYIGIAGLLIVALVYSGNRSSVLGLLVGTGAGFAFYGVRSGTLRGWRGALTLACFALVGALPFITRASWARPVTARVPVLGKLSSGVDSTRIIQWRAAVAGIRDRPLLGVGPENYQLIWSQYHHPEMQRFTADSRWDRAHNAYLDAFATSGILGFLSLLAIWLALAWSLLRADRNRVEEGARLVRADLPLPMAAVAVGSFVAYAFYLFFWFFDLSSTMLWIALAAFVVSSASGAPLIKIGTLHERRWQSSVVLAAGAMALVAVLYVHGFETLRMARALDRARHVERPLQETLADFESVFASPAPVTQHAFVMYAGNLRSHYPAFAEIRNDPARSALFDRAFLLAIKEFERQADQDPLNERTLVQHARVLMLGAYYYGNQRLYESALRRLERAVKLAPRRVNTHLVLGMAYLNAQRPREALKVFEQAYSIYPPLGQTHSYLADAHAALGDYPAAARWLSSAMLHGYFPDESTVRAVAMRLADQDMARDGAELMRLYLHKKIGPTVTWTSQPAAVGAEYSATAAFAGDLFLRAGDSASARALHRGAEVSCSREIPLLQLGRNRSSSPLPDCRQPWRSAPSR
ncbi:MAG: O-antigen ligase family protein [Gemmatimonadaceae bacterium]